MKFLSLSSLLLSLALRTFTSATASHCPTQPATPTQQRAIFSAFVDSYYIKGNLTASFDTYFSEDFIQHTPAVIGNGRKNTTDWLQPYWSCLDFTLVKNVFVDR